jgi:hypothetical protein
MERKNEPIESSVGVFDPVGEPSATDEEGSEMAEGEEDILQRVIPDWVLGDETLLDGRAWRMALHGTTLAGTASGAANASQQNDSGAKLRRDVALVGGPLTLVWDSLLNPFIPSKGDTTGKLGAFRKTFASLRLLFSWVMIFRHTRSALGTTVNEDGTIPTSGSVVNEGEGILGS